VGHLAPAPLGADQQLQSPRVGGGLTVPAAGLKRGDGRTG
jgi:hypothetical protein